MIKHNNNSFSSVYDETTVIGKIMKGTLKVYESWRKLIASGVPPLTLQKCKGVDLVDYKLYGNSVQGENIVKYPYYRESGFSSNGITYTINNDKSITANGTATEDSYFQIDTVTFKANKTYIISRSPKNSSSSTYFTFINGIKEIYNEDVNITLTEEKTSVYYIIIKKGTTVENITFYPRIVEPPTPDAPVEVESVGEKTKNLLDVKNAPVYHTNPYEPSYQWERTETGFKIQFFKNNSGSWNRHGYRIGTTEELKGKTITISYGKYTGPSQKPIISIFTTNIEGESAFNFDNVSSYSDGYIGGSSTINSLIDNGNYNNYNKLTYTIPESTTDKYVGIAFYVNPEASTSANDVIEYKNIQFEISDNATEYEPYGYKIPVKASNDTEEITTNIYLNEPLRKIGDYTDYIDFDNMKVVRNVEKLVVNGSESWYTSFDNGKRRVFLNNRSSVKQNIVLSDKYFNDLVNLSYPDINKIVVNSVGSVIIGVDNTIFPDIETYKTWLKTNNVTIYLPLATPTEETIELSDIPTIKGTTILEVDTTIQPSNMEVTYMGKK